MKILILAQDEWKGKMSRRLQEENFNTQENANIFRIN